MDSEKNLAEREQSTVILSGPTSGLGRALLDRFIELDLNVVTIGRGMERIDSVVEISSNDICSVEFDFSTKVTAHILKQIQSTVNTAVMHSDSRNMVFVSNAGIVGPIGKAVNILTDELENSLRVNCLSPLAIAQLLTRLAEKMGKRLLLVNISTGATVHPIRGWLPYCTSKLACKMALDVLAEENQHIELIHYDPGVIDTEMQGYIRNQSRDDMPDVDLFKGFKTEGVLKSLDEISAEIVDVILGLTK